MMYKYSSGLVFMFVTYFVAAAASSKGPSHPGLPATIDPVADSDLLGPSLTRLNRASEQVPQVIQDEGDSVGVALVRPERNLLKGLPLPTAALITELLLSLNNLLAKLDVTVVLLPSPFPTRFANCVPGCFQNADCRGAITTNANEEAGSPLDAVLGLLGHLGGV